jgi:uncharacterized Zn finger protein
MIDLEPLLKCVSCGSQDTRFIEMREKDQIHVCNECGLLFVKEDNEMFSTLEV